MGLFSGTKKFAYRLGINYAQMDYGSFVDTFRDYAKSEEFAALLNDHDFTVENTEVEYTPYIDGSEPSDFPYKMNLTMAPYGTINFAIIMKGEKQGLAMVYFALTFHAELNRTDKEWFLNFCKAIHEQYEKAFVSYNKENKPLFCLSNDTD